jgi:hypothetical protein
LLKYVNVEVNHFKTSIHVSLLDLIIEEFIVMIKMLVMVEVTSYDELLNYHYFDLMEVKLHLLINYFESIKCLFELIQYLEGFILCLIGFII